MKVDRYIEKFIALGERVEETFSFEIKPSAGNPKFAAQEADKIENELKKFVRDESVGLDFNRNGFTFHIKVTAYTERLGHMDKFSRIKTLFLDHSSYTPIREIEG